MKKIIIDNITKRIDHLEGLYSDQANNGDIKALQGMERCIELLMRLYGVDGKSQFEDIEDDIIGDNSMINLSDLSTETIKELLTLAECCDKTERGAVKPKKQITKHTKVNSNCKKNITETI